MFLDVRVVGVAAVLLSGGFGWSDLDPGEYVVEGSCRDPDDGGGHREFHLEGSSTTETVVTSSTVVPTSEEPPETTTTESDVPTTGTTEPVGPVPQNIEECEAQVQDADAHLAYEPERTMVVGRKYEVTAAVSLDEVPSDVTFEASTTVVTIDGVRCTIRAGLTGPDFDITERSSAKQSFIGTRTLVWIWDVRPRHDGDDLELSLSLTATIFEAGRDVDGPTKLHEAVIDVDTVSRSAWARFGDGVNDFLHDPIVAGIIGAIVTAVLLALGPRTYRKVREGVDRRRAARANAAASARPPE